MRRNGLRAARSSLNQKQTHERQRKGLVKAAAAQGNAERSGIPCEYKARGVFVRKIMPATLNLLKFEQGGKSCATSGKKRKNSPGKKVKTGQESFGHSSVRNGDDDVPSECPTPKEVRILVPQRWRVDVDGGSGQKASVWPDDTKHKKGRGTGSQREGGE